MPKQNTAPANYPQAVIQQIEQLAQNIVTARKRRNETQAQWAGRLGVSQPTMARIERGDPSVAMASYVMCMWLVNQAHGLADLIAPQNDHASLEQEVAKTRSRPKSAPRASAKKIKTASAPPDDLKSLGALAVIDQRGIYSPASSRVTAQVAEVKSELTFREAKRSAVLGVHGTPANARAAGLAALLSGVKKPQP